MKSYDELIQAKIKNTPEAGFSPKPIKAPLFDWQKHIVNWAIRQGRCALFEDCGLGKTPQQLEWARQVSEHTGGNVLILTPLAVAEQTIREGKKFGIRANHIHSPAEIKPGISVTNYEKLDLFDGVEFSGVVLDESSILKNFSGKTRIALTNRFASTPYRLCCTATPSPNDFTEIGQHADFLGICSPAQMLATYFINDTFDTGTWRLKGHAESAFWAWLGSWAACISKPSDIGFSDDGYILPKLNLKTTLVEVDERGSGDELFKNATLSATTMHRELRETAKQRAEAVAELVNKSKETWIVWCNTNVEADELKAIIPDAIEIRGSDAPEKKEKRLEDFSSGRARAIISKPSICGYGLNWQHCRNVAFVGLSYSFEDFYQALRRSYRFGQTKPVNAYIVQARTEGAILQAINKKIGQHQKMQEQMKIAALSLRKGEKPKTMKTDIHKKTGNGWELYHGDCVRVAKTLNEESIDCSIFSPPFADLFTYSSDPQDMGNCNNKDEFAQQFRYLIDELLRITKAGRMACVHCNDLLSTKWKHGKIEYQDFSGDIVRAFRGAGWHFHSRITIWKDPVVEMQRTKAHGLLYKTLRTDSSDSRTGSPEYMLIFRKPGENKEPITHTPEDFPLDQWQEWASPVWKTIDQGKVLNGEMARDEQDERHICPLQLDVIERCLVMWSNPGDTIFSPFAGIGSEGYQSLKMGRGFIGAELKESYFNQACSFLQNATAQMELELA
jgi:DNA modification methylase